MTNTTNDKNEQPVVDSNATPSSIEATGNTVEQTQPAYTINTNPEPAPQAPVEQTPKPKKKWDFSSWLLAATIGGAALFGAAQFDLIKVPSFGQKIGVIDTNILIMSVSAQVNERLLKGEIDLNQSQYEIKNHVDRIYKEAEKYAKDGYTILPSQNTIFYSEDHDLTAEIAEKLELDYDAGLKELEKSKLGSTDKNAFNTKSAVSQNGAQNNPSLPEGSTFEDHSNLELSLDGGQTSDLALFENNQ